MEAKEIRQSSWAVGTVKASAAPETVNWITRKIWKQREEKTHRSQQVITLIWDSNPVLKCSEAKPHIGARQRFWPAAPFLLPPPLSYVRCHSMWLFLKGLFGAQKGLGGSCCDPVGVTVSQRAPGTDHKVFSERCQSQRFQDSHIYHQLQLNTTSSPSYKANWEADVEKVDNPLLLLAAGQQWLWLWGRGGETIFPLSHRMGHTVCAIGCSSCAPSALFGVTVVLLWVNGIWDGAKGVD